MKNILWAIGHDLLLDNIISARNCELTDSAGTKFIDMESGVWCTNIGHSHPKIIETIQLQAEKIMHTGFNYCNPVIDEAAEEILEITGLTDGKCEFLCSGSEAVEFCMRIAKSIHPEKKVLVFSDSYFGAYGEAANKENKDRMTYNWLECSCNINGKGCVGGCEEFSKIRFDKIGIFLFEPGSSSGLVRFPSNRLIEQITSKVREANGLIISNEVTTGVGRTGKWFGFQHYNMKPDLVAIGKGIGNGYPVSVAAVSKEVSKLASNSHFHYSQSHQNDPLGAAVVKTVIEVIRNEELLTRAKLLSSRFNSELSNLNSNNSLIREIRGRGLMLAIELTGEAGNVQKKLLERGFIVAKRSGCEVLRLDPAMTIPIKEFEFFIETFKTCVEQP